MTSNIDNNFIFSINQEGAASDFVLSYVVFGPAPQSVCSSCQQKMHMLIHVLMYVHLEHILSLIKMELLAVDNVQLNSISLSTLLLMDVYVLLVMNLLMENVLLYKLIV